MKTNLDESFENKSSDFIFQLLKYLGSRTHGCVVDIFIIYDIMFDFVTSIIYSKIKITSKMCYDHCL